MTVSWIVGQGICLVAHEFLNELEVEETDGQGFGERIGKEGVRGG